jgi:type I restriction enzyme S subunit
MSAQVLSPAQLLLKFEDYMHNLSVRVQRNNEESRTLTALRDTLLPKLISGEIRVKDAERFLVNTL